MSIRVRNTNLADDQLLRDFQPGGAGTDRYQGFVICDSAGNPVDIVASAKGVQGARGLATQNLRDAGRARVLFSSEALAGATAESALLSFVSTTDVTAAAAATSYTVPAGRTLVLQSYDVLVRNTGTATAVGNVRLRLRSAGTAALANTSPIMWGIGLGWPFAATATLEHNGHKSGAFPDGMEFPAGTILGFNLIASTANMTIAMYINGYTY